MWTGVNLQVAGGRIQDRGGGREEEEDGEGLQPAGYVGVTGVAVWQVHNIGIGFMKLDVFQHPP